MKRSFNLILLHLFFLSVAAANPRYPADSLLVSDSLSLVQKAGVLPIAGWQRISYNLPGFGCQFYPSCSNYGVQAIQEHGLLPGIFVTADRIVRCNPAAWDGHLHAGGHFHEPDGRLVDPVVPEMQISQPEKSPLLAAGFSAVVPGSGRIYAGRTWDGIFGLVTFSMMALTAYNSFENDHQISGGIFLAASIAFYGGEIYGAWRTAKYYRPKPRRE